MAPKKTDSTIPSVKNSFLRAQSHMVRFALMGAEASLQTLVRKAQSPKAKRIESQCEPIVLMHGFAGFKNIGMGDIQLFDYFNGVQRILTRTGYQVFAPEVSPFNTPLDRAHDWLHEIEQIRELTGAEKVHLVAHSQGGLDARVLIAPNDSAQDTPLGPLMGLGYSPHVASLTTIATPHLGSVLVDRLDKARSEKRTILKGLVDFLSIAAWIYKGEAQDAYGALATISREYMTRHFNPIIRDVTSVPCFAIAGDPLGGKRVNPLMIDSYETLRTIQRKQGGGANDGLVAVESALFGNLPEAYEKHKFSSSSDELRAHWQVLGIIRADHVCQVGIPLQFPANPDFDHLAMFAGLAQFLDQGYQNEMRLEPDGRWSRKQKPRLPKASRGIQQSAIPC